MLTFAVKHQFLLAGSCSQNSFERCGQVLDGGRTVEALTIDEEVGAPFTPLLAPVLKSLLAAGVVAERRPRAREAT
jgi:hypothetical protein